MTKKTKATFTRQILTIIIFLLIISALYYARTNENPIDLLKESNSLTDFYHRAKDKILEPDKKELPPPPPTTVSTGQWWQVHFTDPNTINDPTVIENSVAEKLIEHINDAHHTIHIASFEFNLTPVADALIEAKNRGVEVQWVTDDEHGLEADHEPGHGQFALLQNAGIPVKDDSRSALMHNKFWIFDREKVWTGSTNITQNGVFKNNNNVIVIDSPELAQIYENEFAEMWNGGEFGTTSPSTPNKQHIFIDSTKIQVYFAAEDDVAEKLIPVIESARQRIRFMAFSFTHDGMGDAMIARANAGVDVKGIFETRGSETTYSELKKMLAAQIQVRQDGNSRTFHHKVIVIDEKTVVTGSFNFSRNANKNNDENVIIITNKDITAQYIQEFERRWAEAHAPDLS